MNASLVPLATWSGSDFPSGYAFIDTQGLRMTGPTSGSGAGGTIGRVDPATGEWMRPTRVAEQPLIAGAGSAFTRTLAPLANRTAVLARACPGVASMLCSERARTLGTAHPAGALDARRGPLA